MTTRSDGSHVVIFPRPIVNPLDGGVQKSILVGKDDYESLKASASAAGMGIAAYISYLLSQHKSPFEWKAAEAAYPAAALYVLRKGKAKNGR